MSLIWGVALLSLKCLAHFLLLYFDQFFNDAPYKLEFLSLDGTNSNGKSVENGGKMIELPTFPDQVQSEFGTKWKHSENLAQRTLPISTPWISAHLELHWRKLHFAKHALGNKQRKRFQCMIYLLLQYNKIITLSIGTGSSIDMALVYSGGTLNGSNTSRSLT